MTKIDSNEDAGGDKRRGRPTMTDVARIAGVSQSSVSLVLNQMSGARISPETQQRVFDAARQVGYKLPGTRHEAADGSERRTIAYLVDEISTSPHPVVSLDGARDFAFEQNFLVSTYVTRSNPELEEATIEAVKRDKSVIGVIYSSIFTRHVTLPKALEGVPTVLLNCYAEPRKHIAILPGEVAGSFTATAHLTELGHRRIGFINGEPWMDASVDRLKGYRQALATADIAFDERLIRNGDWLPLTGYHHALDLLGADNPPTAILCGNDLMAMGAMEAAQEMGLKVPDELTIMGYDDQELARYTHPPLTTLVLPNYEMGQRAAEALLDITIHGKKLKPMTIKIDGPLVIRATTAAPAAVPAPANGLRVAR
ncbi:LacI family DNA-binding transcriptional regulator [Mesorhizobium sp. LHD-90]|uniref:LacI family DNA-binding transcriptional regulator n=1 Tax=Mesorhizobium sp. LHD-90 TaxID=3071414 RepID=UPI0027E1AEB3|nr:LacI family DNA-binding transcriptional regulator [Mesorhizobium sp. LHD-90]MDQ6432815.1 LacI family DNA-binding transcriptional regulator [Mesorhizobium sp. LHD-90]